MTQEQNSKGRELNQGTVPLDASPSGHPGDGGWRPIETAPKDGTPIIGWCVHDADPYWIEPPKNGRAILTLYGAHTEGLSHVEDGAHIIVWGGSFDDSSYEEPNGAYLPDWWFRYGSEFEETANPTHWMPLPAAPGSPVVSG